MRSLTVFVVAVSLFSAPIAAETCVGQAMEYQTLSRSQMLSYFNVADPSCGILLKQYAGINASSTLTAFSPSYQHDEGGFELAVAPPAALNERAYLAKDQMLGFFTFHGPDCEQSFADFAGNSGKPLLCIEPLGNGILVGFPLDQ